MFINLIAKWSGLGWIWGKLDGAKAYLVGTATILTGVAGLIQEFTNVSGQHDFSALLKFAQSVPHDPMWAAILTGAGIIAAAHKADKVISASAQPKSMAIMVPLSAVQAPAAPEAPAAKPKENPAPAAPPAAAPPSQATTQQ